MKKFISLSLILLFSQSVFCQQWYSSFQGRVINDAFLFSNANMITVGGNFTNDSIQSVRGTDNAGLSWNIYTDAISSWLTSVDFIDTATALAVGTNGKIIKTTNKGQTWINLSSPVNRDFNSVVYVDTQNAVIAGGKESPRFGTLLKTSNGGQTWSVVFDQPGPPLRSVYFINANTGYAVGDSGTILKSVNGGTTWSSVSSPVVRNLNSIYFAGNNIGLIVGGDSTNQTILRTTDGGDTWNVIKDVTGSVLLDVSFFSTDTGYASGINAALLKTVDAGLTWQGVSVTNAPSSTRFNAVRFFDNEFGVVLANDGLVYVYTVAALPQAFTTGYENTFTNTYKITGLVNTFNYPATYSYVYADNPAFSFALATYPKTVISNGLFPVEDFIYNLTPNTRYYFYQVASNYAGTAHGDTLSFYNGTTSQYFNTLPASQLTTSSALLNGRVAGYSFPINLRFEYGTTPALGTTIAATPASVSDTNVHNVSASLSSLQSNALYFYRLKGSSAQGNFTGNLQFFTTGDYDFYSAFRTDAATLITSANAQLNGFANGFTLPSQLTFEYSSNLFSWTSVPANPSYINDGSQHSIQAFVSGLQGSTAYYVRLKAVNSLGAFYADTVIFYTGAAPVILRTGPASSVGTTSVTLNAYTKNEGNPLTFKFQYGPNLQMSSEVSAAPLNTSDTLAHNLRSDLTGLTPNTTYYYRIQSTDGQGTQSPAEIRQFFTAANTIPNWDFQNWSNVSTLLPVNWRFEGDLAALQQVPGHTGNYAMQLSGEAFGVMGRLRAAPNGDGPDFFGGIPFNFRPDSVILYAKYNVVAGDSAIMLVLLFNNGVPVSNDFYRIATGSSGPNFQRIAFKLNYTSALTPDSIVFGLLPTNAFAGFGSSGNSITIDDIGFAPAGAPVLPNAGFENWVTLNKTVPDEWRTFSNVSYNFADNSYQPMVVQAPFNNMGDLAAEIRTLNIDGDHSYMNGSLSSGLHIFNEGASFPLHIRHERINGYYKYFPQGNDAMAVKVKLFRQSQYVGYAEFITTYTTPEYTMFDIPISYQDTATIPDSATIDISASNKFPAGESVAFIDKLGFDGFYDSVYIYTPVKEIQPDRQPVFSYRLFPNPTTGQVFIKLENTSDALLEVYDITGNKLYQQNLTTSVSSFNATGLANGIYVVRVTSQNITVPQRLVIINGL